MCNAGQRDILITCALPYVNIYRIRATPLECVLSFNVYAHAMQGNESWATSMPICLALMCECMQRRAEKHSDHKCPALCE